MCLLNMKLIWYGHDTEVAMLSNWLQISASPFKFRWNGKLVMADKSYYGMNENFHDDIIMGAEERWNIPFISKENKFWGSALKIKFNSVASPKSTQQRKALHINSKRDAFHKFSSHWIEVVRKGFKRSSIHDAMRLSLSLLIRQKKKKFSLILLQKLLMLFCRSPFINVAQALPYT